MDSKVRSLPWRLAAVTPSKVSAQSPPCSTNASPAATLAILNRSLSHSAAKTSGGSGTQLADHLSRPHRMRRRSGCWRGFSACSASSVGTWLVSDTQTL